MLVFVKKLHLFLGKSTKTVATRAALFWLKYAPNRLLAGALPQTPLGKLTAFPKTPLAVFRGLLLGGGGRERRGGEGEEWRRGEVTEGVRPLS